MDKLKFIDVMKNEEYSYSDKTIKGGRVYNFDSWEEFYEKRNIKKIGNNTNFQIGGEDAPIYKGYEIKGALLNDIPVKGIDKKLYQQIMDKKKQPITSKTSKTSGEKTSDEKPTKKNHDDETDMEAWEESYGDNDEYMDKHKDMFISAKDRIHLNDIIDEEYLSKFPQKDVDTLTRLLNAKNANKWKRISEFTGIEGQSGAGTIQSQAGELLSMFLVSLPPDQAEKLYEEIKKHLMKRYGEGKISATKMRNIDSNYQLTMEWLESAYATRTAMNLIAKEHYPEINDVSEIIVRASWDRKETVEAMSKGYYDKKTSTVDTFFKIRDPKTGEYRMIEISLKKSFEAMLYNGGLQDVIKRMEESGINISKINYNKFKNITDDAYSKLEELLKNEAEKKNFNKFVKEKIADKTLKTNKDGSLPPHYRRKALSLYFKKHEKGKKILDQYDKEKTEYINNVVKTMGEDKKMMNEIVKLTKERIPLEDIVKGFENLVAGSNAVTQKALQKIFGVEKWEDVKERITIKKDEKGQFYMAYQCGKTKNFINVANIFIRLESMHSGIIKFEMKFPHKDDENGIPYLVMEYNKEFNENNPQNNSRENKSLKDILISSIEKIKIENIKLENFFLEKRVQSR